MSSKVCGVNPVGLGRIVSAEDILPKLIDQIESRIPLDQERSSYPAYFTEFVKYQLKPYPKSNVLVLAGGARIEGDLQLDYAAEWTQVQDIIAIVCEDDLAVEGDVYNRSLSAGPMLYVAGDLQVRNLVKSGAPVIILGDVISDGIVIGEYNDGVMRVGGNLASHAFFLFDHDGYVRGEVRGPRFHSDDEIMSEILVDDVFEEIDDDCVSVDRLWQRARAGLPYLRD